MVPFVPLTNVLSTVGVKNWRGSLVQKRKVSLAAENSEAGRVITSSQFSPKRYQFSGWKYGLKISSRYICFDLIKALKTNSWEQNFESTRKRVKTKKQRRNINFGFERDVWIFILSCCRSVYRAPGLKKIGWTPMSSIRLFSHWELQTCMRSYILWDFA